MKQKIDEYYDDLRKQLEEHKTICLKNQREKDINLQIRNKRTESFTIYWNTL